jgi:hypothetical protein
MRHLQRFIGWLLRPLANERGSIFNALPTVGTPHWTELTSPQGPYSQTFFAGSQKYTGTKEQRITSCIADAAAYAAANPGPIYVLIPGWMLPYNPSLVSGLAAFSAVGGRLIREGGPAEHFDVVAYGAASDGVTNDSAAILAAANAANTNVAGGVGGTVFFSYFSKNNYFLTSPLTFNAYTDVTFQGAGGPNGTRITMGAAGAHCFNFTGVCSRITIRDFMLVSTVAWASGFGLSVVGTAGTHSDSFQVERVTIQNIPTPFNLQYCDNSVFRTIHYYQNVASATVGAVFSIDTCIQNSLYDFYDTIITGTLPGNVYTISGDCDTLEMFDCTALNAGAHGFRFTLAGGTSGPRLIRVYGAISETSVQSGYSIEAGRDLRFTDCHAAVNTLQGFSVTGGTSITFTSCLALQNSQHGFDIEGGTTVGLMNCSASNNSQQTTNTYDGIRVAAAYTRVIGCRSGDFVFTLTNKQRFGISLAAVDFVQIRANELDGNFSGPVQDFSVGQPHSLVEGSTATGVVLKRLPTVAIVLTDAATVAVDASLGTLQRAGLTASRTIGNPANGVGGQTLTITVFNNSAGAITTTWSANWHLAGAWVDPAAGKERSLFCYSGDGTIFREISRSAADVTP